MTYKQQFLSIITIMLAAASLPATAEPHLSFSAQCEAALAYSALPLHLRDRANVWLLGEDGYALQGESSKDFSCIVARNHPGSIIPQCFDRPGQAAILPKFLDEGRLLRSGLDFAGIKKIIDERLANGEYATAEGPGLVYMMSPYNYIFGANAKRLLHIRPHVMFHAPNLPATAVGNDFSRAMQNTGLPFVIDEGPHGYMISMVEKASDPSAVEAACEGELPDPPG